ncbi:MAG TPA: alpha-amylase family glycosyl hydrolase [Ignavibacteriales bacterium]|nr:alpha-amylase family glycosyl hydrolase [Ignavibacteriales bacterium]
MASWADDAVFYHIYPIGFCGAPKRNDLNAPPVPRLDKLFYWVDHIKQLGVTALYLGPVFESSSHGYNTIDYFMVDRRLGDNQLLARVVEAFHNAGIRVILDAVYNHVGRDFWAFKDVQQNGQSSRFCNWFHGIDYTKKSPKGDNFSYEGWKGHDALVKLNLANPETRDHLLEATRVWINDFNIDGLRLDAADCIDFRFMRELNSFTKKLKSDFWLMGEVVHGDYTQWANPDTLHSVTNYEAYKGLYSSLNDKNYFEIAYSLNRQFGRAGIYRDIPLYNFADNHDVNRVASMLKDPAHLYPLYCMLFTMPGIPSIYYGSEWGIEGAKTHNSDDPLRPCIELHGNHKPQPELYNTLQKLAYIRNTTPALRHGTYEQLHLESQLFAYKRQTGGSEVIVALNSSDKPQKLELPAAEGAYTDILNGGAYKAANGKLMIEKVYPNWACMMKRE